MSKRKNRNIFIGLGLIVVVGLLFYFNVLNNVFSYSNSKINGGYGTQDLYDKVTTDWNGNSVLIESSYIGDSSDNPTLKICDGNYPRYRLENSYVSQSKLSLSSKMTTESGADVCGYNYISARISFVEDGILTVSYNLVANSNTFGGATSGVYQNFILIKSISNAKNLAGATPSSDGVVSFSVKAGETKTIALRTSSADGSYSQSVAEITFVKVGESGGGTTPSTNVDEELPTIIDEETGEVIVLEPENNTLRWVLFSVLILLVMFGIYKFMRKRR